jgi:hypothetical protein
MNLPIVHLHGTPYEQGRQHGAALSDLEVVLAFGRAHSHHPSVTDFRPVDEKSVTKRV